MTGFVDPADQVAVEAVLGKAVAALGPEALIAQLAAVPDLQVQPARAGRLLKAAVPAVVAFGARRLVLDGTGMRLEHLVGGVVLGRDPVTRTGLPGVLAGMVCGAVVASGATDEVSVLLTALRDAVDIA